MASGLSPSLCEARTDCDLALRAVAPLRREELGATASDPAHKYASRFQDGCARGWYFIGNANGYGKRDDESQRKPRDNKEKLPGVRERQRHYHDEC